jgi:4-hydroxy-tetrahydrodipicolinate synthase
MKPEVAMANPPSRIPLPRQIEGSRAHLFGISAALVTPFDSSGAIDFPAAAKHAVRVIASGADSITLFGTTGEGASIGLAERAALLDRIVEAAVDAARVNVCICANDLELARTQAEQALVRGVRTLLLTPPFYFKGVDDRALTNWFAHFIEKLPARDARLILYHIPQVTQVGLSIPLIRQLKDRFGDTIFGIKDSSGDWEHIQALLSFEDLATLIGDERLLARAAPLGGAGAISGMANFTADMLSRIVLSGVDNDILCTVVDEVVRHPVTPMVKAMVGAFYDEPGWTDVRPPLSPAREAVARQLIDMLQATRPGY